MENKINIAELLKDCPQGMELDCTKYSNVYFIGVDYKKEPKIKLKIETSGTWCSELTLNEYGKESSHPNAKCLILPKGKTTWEGFQRPFQDGDILVNILGNIYIYKPVSTVNFCGSYASVNSNGVFISQYTSFLKDSSRYATEEEKQKLFDAIKANGYKWNEETKTLEKLVEPKFKVGNKVRVKKGVSEPRIIEDICDTFYTLVPIGKIDFTDQDNWELVPNKFDITTLKPFDKVLVRDHNAQEWVASLFSNYNEPKKYKYICVNGSGYAQCIPYEGNEHLLGTTNDCDEYYKTW